MAKSISFTLSILDGRTKIPDECLHKFLVEEQYILLYDTGFEQPEYTMVKSCLRG